jgi:hypothetical protein
MKPTVTATVCLGIALASSVAMAQSNGATRMMRDVNGRWQPIETRSVDVRETSPGERVEVETIRRPDSSGTLVVAERRVTHRTDSSAGEQMTIETYAGDDEGFVRSDGRLALRDRVRISTTVTPNGDRQRVEELEGRDPVAPRDPMRIMRRLVETTRRTSPDRWVTERQVFELDIEGRLVPVLLEREEAPPR